MHGEQWLTSPIFPSYMHPWASLVWTPASEWFS